MVDISPPPKVLHKDKLVLLDYVTMTGAIIWGAKRLVLCQECTEHRWGAWLAHFLIISSPIDSAIPGRKGLRFSLWLYIHRFARFCGCFQQKGKQKKKKLCPETGRKQIFAAQLLLKVV